MRYWRTLLAVFIALGLGLWLGLSPARTTAPAWSAQDGSKEITFAQLPPEGRHTLILIRQGGPFPYSKDGATFGNREGLLPSQPRGYYREFTVPTPGLEHRGARRIVAGRGGDYWYTEDHYRSFRRIRE
mgnify:CR=1 FL=1